MYNLKRSNFLMIIVLLTFMLSALNIFAQSGGWTTKSPMPTTRKIMSATLVGDKIYVIGGLSASNQAIGDVEVYDPSSDTWEKKQNMGTPRGYVSTCTVDGIVYAFGGGYPSVFSIVEAYDSLTNSWTTKASMPSKRWLPSQSAVVDGTIYVIGGATSSSSSSRKVEAYDPETDTWSIKKDMPEAGGLISLAVVDSLIFSFGGGWYDVSALKTVLVYNTKTDTWQKKTDMPTPRFASMAYLVNGIIYVVGGVQSYGGPGLSNVEIYDPKTDTWSKSADMPVANKLIVGAVVNGKIYVIGGMKGYQILTSVEEFDPSYTGGINDSRKIKIVNFQLAQNYPNPFNIETVIQYQLPFISNVELSIYNVAGQKIRTIVKAQENSDYYRVYWDGKDACGFQVPSGVYLYQLRASEFIQTRKMSLLN